MFEIGFEWWRGLGQIAIYSAVIVSILWIMSKIPTGGESPSSKEKGKGNE